MTKKSSLQKPFQASSPLSIHLNIYGYFDAEGTFLTKSGDLGVTLLLDGLDPECKTPEELGSIVNRCATAISRIDSRFWVTTYLLKKRAEPIPPADSLNPVVHQALWNRFQFLRGKAEHLYSSSVLMTVIMKPDPKSSSMLELLDSFLQRPIEMLRRSFQQERRRLVMDADVSRRLKTLHEVVDSFIEQTTDVVHARLLSSDESFHFLRTCLNPDPEKAIALRKAPRMHVDFLAADSVLEAERTHLRLDERPIKTLTLKRLPASTFANMLGDITRINAEMLVAMEWNVLDGDIAARRIRAIRRFSHAGKISPLSGVLQERPYEREILFDDSKEAVVAELGECLAAIETRSIRVGEFSLTVMVYGTTLQAAQRTSAAVMKAVGAHDGAMNDETYNGLNAFLAAMPGGHPYNLRRLLATSETHADLALWFRPHCGEVRNVFLNAPYLAVFETDDGSLFYFNLHVYDVPHALILGATGSGKSYTLNFLLTCALQYSPQIIIFDVGGSYKSFAELLGGAYIPFRADELPFSINPFCLPPTKANLQFLFLFVKVLIESDGHRTTDAQDRELFEAISSLYFLDAAQRRLLTLSTTVSKGLAVHLKRWTEGEQFGSWFDSEVDTVTFAHLQCLDFEGMDRLGVVVQALLFYLLHRANDIIDANPAAFKVVVFDESWLLFTNPIMRAYILNAVRTWRKKNAAMILATQSLQDLSGEHRPLVENCPTKLLLSNPNLDAAFYENVLRLNSVEIEKVRKLRPKGQFLLKREDVSKVLTLNVDPRSHWLYTTNPYESKRRQDLVNQLGLEAALDVLSGGSTCSE